MNEMEEVLEREDRDALFMMTEACNSNCVMCPMSVDSRRRGRSYSDEEVDLLLDTIPDDVEHIDITGGEPFLRWRQVLRIMRTINERWPEAEVLVLTNGRALSLDFLRKEIRPLLTSRYQFAIPIHAPVPERHDRITLTQGSFAQSMAGIRFLSDTPARVEVRVVAHKLNMDVLSDTCDMLCACSARIDVVHLVAMEMNGCAARNRKALWVDYDRLYRAAEPGLMNLIQHQIDVGLYDFPLCALPKHAWPLARRSITPWKVRYPRECDACSVKDACGGLFRSTELLGICPVYPIAEEKPE